MNKVMKFEDYQNWEAIATNFIYQIKNSRISESEESNISDDTFNKACEDIFKNFGFNLELTLTFGAGVKLFFPIVSKFVETLQLEIKPTFEDVVLLCVTIISIIYLRYKKEPPISAEDIKNKLNPEVQLKFGNPRKLVSNLVTSFKQIFQFIKKFPKLFGVSLNNIFDMFSYTTILIPVMNTISWFCSKYNVTPDNLAGNLASLGVGISTIASKRLIQLLINKFGKDKELSSQEDPSVLADVTDLEQIDMGRSKLIKEQ